MIQLTVQKSGEDFDMKILKIMQCHVYCSNFSTFQSMASLRLLAEKQNKTVTEVMKPFKEILEDMVPPKKHLLKHQPAIAQMGLMDGNMFCTTLTPRLFEISEFF